MNKVVHYNSDEAAQYKTGIGGWVSADGRFWGDNEHMARWCGCTHQKCESCENDVAKGYIRCESCREKIRKEKFDAMPRLEWDGVTPLTLDDGDEYFFDEDDLLCYLHDNDVSVDDLDLVICQPVNMRLLDEDYFLEDLHEDAECSEDLSAAIEKVNEIIRKEPPQCWEPGKYAAIVKFEEQ